MDFLVVLTNDAFLPSSYLKKYIFFNFTLLSRSIGVEKHPIPKLKLDLWIPQAWQTKIKYSFSYMGGKKDIITIDEPS